ncbi:MAG: competence/damage-inducible protein A [Acidimicrobiia bacterium]
MRCEVVAVGTELLLGQIVDTNSSVIGERLAASGIDSLFQTKVGDNLERIVSVLRQALDRSDAVIVCGGLGPTHDDITREAIAEVMGVELELHSDIGDRIREMFAARGRPMAENNLRQAMVPRGAAIIPQVRGTAPGLICPVSGHGSIGAVGDKVIYAVPGVPHEMVEMLERAILPDLQRRSGTSDVIGSRTLRTWGESESGLAERLAPTIDRLDAQRHATLAFLASGMEGIKVRLTAKAPDAASLAAILDAEEQTVRAELGSLAFGVDDDTMESVVLDLLRARGATLAVAESVTGGFVGARLTSIPGASDVFRGAIVSYASAVKFDLLGVPEGPVVSAEAAQAMALGVRRVLGADVGLSLTGVAGPSEQDGQSVGTLFVGLAIGENVESTSFRLPPQRDIMRQLSVISALNFVRARLT